MNPWILCNINIHNQGMYQAKVAKEERGTGIGGKQLTEKEALLEELIDIRDETEQSRSAITGLLESIRVKWKNRLSCRSNCSVRKI